MVEKEETDRHLSVEDWKMAITAHWRQRRQNTLKYHHSIRMTVAKRKKGGGGRQMALWLRAAFPKDPGSSPSIYLHEGSQPSPVLTSTGITRHTLRRNAYIPKKEQAQNPMCFPQG